MSMLSEWVDEGSWATLPSATLSVTRGANPFDTLAFGMYVSGAVGHRRDQIVRQVSGLFRSCPVSRPIANAAVAGGSTFPFRADAVSLVLPITGVWKSGEHR